MKAQSLTICVPYKGCDKNCPYCISKMTGSIETNSTVMGRNIEKAITFAKAADVTNVIVTGKGEPCLNMSDVIILGRRFKTFPLELQTNGIVLSKKQKLVEDLYIAGYNVIAISVDSLRQLVLFTNLFRAIRKLGILSRAVVNVTQLTAPYEFENFIEICKKIGIDQLSFRKVVAPKYIEDTDNERHDAVKWIQKWVYDSEYVQRFFKLLDHTLSESPLSRVLMKLPYGATIYDYNGIAVTWFDYCVQDSNNGDDIRSLIFQEDGHMYSAWNSKASKLF